MTRAFDSSLDKWLEPERKLEPGKETAPPLTFAEYVRAHNPGTPNLMEYEHIPRLVRCCQKLVDTYADPSTGKLAENWREWVPGEDGINWRALMILEPRRYFKSEVCSRLLPAYFLYRFPILWAGVTSYEANQSQGFSRAARDHFLASGGEIRTDSKAVSLWQTTSGGGLFASGTGGPLLGKGYHLGICDDPIKPENVLSLAFQKRFIEWWPGTFISGSEPGASRLFVMQRLGTEDPVDFLWRREVGEKTDVAPENWHVIVCDEVYSEEPLWRGTGPKGLPDTCTLEPDPRVVGEYLSPLRFSPAAVDKKQLLQGPGVSASQAQQRPGALSGDFWRHDDFIVYNTLPSDAYNGGTSWDTAYTKDEANSASAFVRSFRGPGGPDDFPIYIEAVEYRHLEIPELVAWMKSIQGPHHIEAKASGKSAKQLLDRSRVVAYETKVTGGDKLSRASTVQPVVRTRRVFVNHSVADTLFNAPLQGLLRVTVEQLVAGGPGLDVNDAFVLELQRHTSPADIGFGRL